MFFACCVLYVVVYLAIEDVVVGRPTHRLFLPLEPRIPIIPEAQYVYLIGYLLPLVVIVELRDAGVVVRLWVAWLLTIAVAFGAFLAFPVEVPRPALQGHSPATVLLAMQYAADKPYNAFPSLHAATSLLIWLSCRQRVRRRVVLLLLVVAISISTVLVKQHYVLDVIAGWLLAVAAWAATGYWQRSGTGARLCAVVSGALTSKPRLK